MTTEISLRDLSHAVGSYVDRAHAGETIRITRNGRPWARLVPEAAASGSDYLDQLIADGRVAPATGSFADLPDLSGPVGPDSTDLLSEMREDRL